MDVRLVWPASKHSGYVTVANCHNLVSIGGWNTIPATTDLSNNAPSRCLYLTGDVGTLFVEGLECDSSGGAMSDGIDLNSPQADVIIENARIDGIFGYYDQFHADCVQAFTGMKSLKIDGLTCSTGYQGLSIGPSSAIINPWTADIEHVNISTINPPIYGSHNDGGYIYWPCDDSACTHGAVTTLIDVFLTPRPGQPFAQTTYGAGPGQLATAAVVTAGTIGFPGSKISGHVDLGPPPGGDFVPAGLSGASYLSPGYAPAP